MDQRPGVRPPAALSPSRCAGQYGAALAIALALYLLSVAPGPLWQDSGLAQVRVLRRDLRGPLGLALSHPLYYVLGFAFQSLPFSESAFKTNLVSAVFGAVTVANAFLLIRLITNRKTPAAVGAASLAVAHTFWQHCALAEVYTVSTALLTAELLCWLQYARTNRAGWLVPLLLANGLGISNHMLAALSLACYSVLVLWLLFRRKVRLATLGLCVVAWVAGAALYLGMIVTAIRSGGGVVETLHSALFGLTYTGSVLNVLPSLRMLINSVMYLTLNFPTPVALLAFLGLLSLRSRRCGPLPAVLAGLLAIHLLWAIRYKVPDQYTFFIPSLVLLAIFIGLGAERFLHRRSARWTIMLLLAALLPAAVYIPLPAIARATKLSIGIERDVPYRDAYAYFLRPWQTGYRGAERFARELQQLLPEGAVLVADGTTVRPVHYMQLTGRWTKNVRVYPPVERTEQTPLIAEQDVVEQLGAGLVYVVTPSPGYCPDWLLNNYELTKQDLVYRVTGRKTSPRG